jgi:hypothetical protein
MVHMRHRTSYFRGALSLVRQNSLILSRMGWCATETLFCGEISVAYRPCATECGFWCVTNEPFPTSDAAMKITIGVGVELKQNNLAGRRSHYPNNTAQQTNPNPNN